MVVETVKKLETLMSGAAPYTPVAHTGVRHESSPVALFGTIPSS